MANLGGVGLLDRAKAVGAGRMHRDGATLALSAPPEAVGAGVRLSFFGREADWNGARSLVFTLAANGAHRLKLHIEHGEGAWTLYLVPRPGLVSQVVLPLCDLRERPENSGHPGYSRFGGGPHPVQLARVRSLTLTFNQVAPGRKFLTIEDLRLAPDVPEPAVRAPTPVVDSLGQWVGLRGRPRRETEIRAVWEGEERPDDTLPGRTARTGAFAALSFGRGAGFFRLERDSRGVWHLVDPEGCAFFSLGCNGVRPESSGPVHEPRLYAGLPLTDFYRANLHRRHGGDDGFAARWSRHAASRLRRWGFNTVGNGSDPELIRRGLLPYVAPVAALAPFCARLPDVYAPGFAAGVRRLIAPEVAPLRDDPLLLGWFVGDGPAWALGGCRHPFNEIFVAPEYAHTRAVAVAWTQARYGGDLSAVDAAWGTALSEWDDLTRGLPDVRTGREALRRDADEFLGAALGRLYGVCSEAIRAEDPNHLLLGGRFFSPDLPAPYLDACAPFDVFSFSRYGWEAPAASIAEIARRTGRPSLVSEFHYGVEGAGLGASRVGVTGPEERGLAYRHFVEGLAALPEVVGAHWFQWVDQPSTGRSDGEAYQVGLVDIADIPYESFLASVKETHGRIEALRRGQGEPYVYPHPRPPAW